MCAHHLFICRISLSPCALCVLWCALCVEERPNCRPCITVVHRFHVPSHTERAAFSYASSPASAFFPHSTAVVLQPLLAVPPPYSPIVHASMSHSFVSPSSFIWRPRVLLKSGVRTGVAAVDREIQHLYEYRSNGPSVVAATPMVDRPIVR